MLIIETLTIIFLLSLLFVINHNFNYNLKVMDLKDEGLDMCLEFIDATQRTLYNYEYYCSDVYKGFENGSIPFLELPETQSLYKELNIDGSLSEQVYTYDEIK